MKLTNNIGIPEPLAKAIANSRKGYSKGEGVDYSVTELIGPAYQRRLIRKHQNSISEEAVDQIWSLLGTSVHYMIEMAQEDQNYISEQRFFFRFYDRLISGQADLIDTKNKIIYDWKVTSAWTHLNGVKPEWEAQLNLLNLLYSKGKASNVGEAEKLYIIAIYRDWKKTDALKNKDYPQKQVAMLPVNLWPLSSCERYLLSRIEAHDSVGIDDVCSDDERWHKDDKYAVKKKTNKKATRVFNDESEARLFIEDKKDMVIEFRPGEDTRCLHYCPVQQFCSHGKKLNTLEKVAA